MTKLSERYLAVNGRVIRIQHWADTDTGAPWQEHDGHGPVSDWTTRDKRPGELVLNSERRAKRFYDFQEACKIARRDGWGISPYRLDIEDGANGLKRATAQHFKGRELVSFRSSWHDDINAAIREVYAAHRATMTAREYAALAAMQDFKRLKAWCDDEWQWIGVVVELLREDGTTESTESLWGIESDAGDYIAETERELIGAIMPGKES